MVNIGAKRREEGAEAAMFNVECWMMNDGTKRREGGKGLHAKGAEDAEGQIDWLGQAAAMGRRELRAFFSN